MIQPKTYYEVVCDHCGELLTLDDITAWQTEEDAKDAMNCCGWQEMQSGKIFCDICFGQESLFNEEKG